jgi:glycerol kinase
VFATEASNASRILVYNIEKGAFDPQLAALFKVPSLSSLPEVKDSAGIFGRTKGLDFLPDGIPISGILGDQQAALAGQTCFREGEAKCTYGTGAFLLMNTGPRYLRSKAGLISTVAWSLKGQLTYAFEGAAFIAGAAVQFLRDQLHLVQDAASTAALAADGQGAPQVYFVPALAGLGVPYWDADARGTIFGLTRGTSVADIVRATLEGVAFQVTDLVQAMASDVPAKIETLRVDGGAAANNLLMQVQANLCGLKVDRPQNLETTATGAALFAGLGIGLYSSLDDLVHVRKAERVFSPQETSEAKELRKRQLEGWQRAVAATQVFAGTLHPLPRN